MPALMRRLRIPVPAGRAVLHVPLPPPNRLARHGHANGRATLPPLFVRTLQVLCDVDAPPRGFLASVARARGVHASTVWRIAVGHAHNGPDA